MYDKISEQKIAKLHPVIREEIKALIDKAEAVIDNSLRIRVVQGLRTIEEQNALYAKGRTQPGPIVTKAKGGSSFHNYGLAIDICWLIQQPDGTYIYDKLKSWNFGPNYKKVVEIFKAAGYTWGGDFKSIKDTPHFEKSFGLSWRELYKRYLAKNFSKDGYINLDK